MQISTEGCEIKKIQYYRREHWISRILGHGRCCPFSSLYILDTKRISHLAVYTFCRTIRGYCRLETVISVIMRRFCRHAAWTIFAPFFQPLCRPAAFNGNVPMSLSQIRLWCTRWLYHYQAMMALKMKFMRVVLPTLVSLIVLQPTGEVHFGLCR